jgi:hypothetical protein
MPVRMMKIRKIKRKSPCPQIAAQLQSFQAGPCLQAGCIIAAIGNMDCSGVPQQVSTGMAI